MRKFIREHITVKLLLPLLFIAYSGSITLFPHSHIIDGCKIVHSHPFAKEHSHDGTEAETIQQLSLFHTDGTIVFPMVPELFASVSEPVAVPRVTDGFSSVLIHYETRRGPPAFLFS